MGSFSVFRLDNGLKCVHLPAAGSASYCGIAVNVGSSDDPEGKFGLAHFVEHTVFKGTEHRSSWQINNRMESIGGELNAYTTKEETLIYTTAPAGNVSRSLELLSDLVKGSRFPKKEIDREKEVVVEEINSYLDSPADSVFDEFEDRLYAGSPLGHNILGTEKDVRGMKPEDCRRFIDDFYVPENMVLYCMDSSSPDRVSRQMEKYFGDLNKSLCRVMGSAPRPNPVFREVIDEDGHQAHTLVGARVFSKNDSRRFALFLLNNYLGGPGMNSRLNQVLREKRGYVYTVDSSVSLYSGAGQLQIYFGCDPLNVDKCLKLIFSELRKLADSTLSESTFRKIQKQYVGQLKVSADNSEMRAMSAAKSLLYYDEVHDADWSAERIMELHPADLTEVAAFLLPEKCSVLTVK